MTLAQTGRDFAFAMGRRFAVRRRRRNARGLNLWFRRKYRVELRGQPFRQRQYVSLRIGHFKGVGLTVDYAGWNYDVRNLALNVNAGRKLSGIVLADPLHPDEVEMQATGGSANPKGVGPLDSMLFTHLLVPGHPVLAVLHVDIDDNDFRRTATHDGNVRVEQIVEPVLEDLRIRRTVFVLPARIDRYFRVGGKHDELHPTLREGKDFGRQRTYCRLPPQPRMGRRIRSGGVDGVD